MCFNTRFCPRFKTVVDKMASCPVSEFARDLVQHSGGAGSDTKDKKSRTVVENGENRVPWDVRDCNCSMCCVCTVNVRFIDRDICYVMVHTVFQPSFRIIGCDVRYLLVYDVFRQSFRSTF